MNIETFDIAGLVVLVPRRMADSRGYLSEIFHAERFAAHGVASRFVQENHIFSEHAGTVRGLHFQVAPKAQAKLVRVTRGAIWDVAVDLRPDSPTFGRHAGVELSDANGKQFWIPAGFAHGFCTLSAGAEVSYKITDYYDPACERGVAWDDPALAIAWPVEPARAVMAERDRQHPRLAELRGSLEGSRP